MISSISDAMPSLPELLRSSVLENTEESDIRYSLEQVCTKAIENIGNTIIPSPLNPQSPWEYTGDVDQTRNAWIHLCDIISNIAGIDVKYAMPS